MFSHATALSQIRDAIDAGLRVAGKCHVEVRPAGRSFDPLCGKFRVQLVSVDDDGERRVLLQDVVDATGLAALFASVPA